MLDEIDCDIVESLPQELAACQNLLNRLRRPRKNSPWPYFAIFNKSSEPIHRDDALNAIGGALEEYGKTKAVFFIEEALRLREKILAAVN